MRAVAAILPPCGGGGLSAAEGRMGVVQEALPRSILADPHPGRAHARLDPPRKGEGQSVAFVIDGVPPATKDPVERDQARSTFQKAGQGIGV